MLPAARLAVRPVVLGPTQAWAQHSQSSCAVRVIHLYPSIRAVCETTQLINTDEPVSDGVKRECVKYILMGVATVLIDNCMEHFPVDLAGYI